MHEMSVVRNIVDMVLEMCEGQNVAHVKSVNLTIGKLHDVVTSLVPGLFNYLARGTVAEGAEVKIAEVPVMLRCRCCGTIFKADVYGAGIVCPSCASESGFDVISGREFSLDSIEIEHAAGSAA